MKNMHILGGFFACALILTLTACQNTDQSADQSSEQTQIEQTQSEPVIPVIEPVTEGANAITWADLGVSWNKIANFSTEKLSSGNNDKGHRDSLIIRNNDFTMALHFESSDYMAAVGEGCCQSYGQALPDLDADMTVIQKELEEVFLGVYDLQKTSYNGREALSFFGVGSYVKVSVQPVMLLPYELDKSSHLLILGPNLAFFDLPYADRKMDLQNYFDTKAYLTGEAGELFGSYQRVLESLKFL